MVSIKLDESALAHESKIELLLKMWQIQVSESSEYLLGYDSSYWIKDSHGRKLQIDFDENKSDYHRSHRGSGEPLARALGFKDGIRKVVDLSAGLAIDSVLLAQIGFEVISVERNPLVSFLLVQSQFQSKREDLKKITFVFADSETFLKKYDFQEPVSAYFDPMYPEKKKSALPRQEMVIFREMVGGDTDSEKILQQSLDRPFHKIVVKRPIKGEPVLQKPNYQLESKLVRYDVYYPRSSS